jgi:hypothetical protein
MLETVAEVDDLSVARVLVTALRAHGFNPMEPGDGGLPGVRGWFNGKLVAVLVPEEEATDARVLADALLKEMQAR